MAEKRVVKIDFSGVEAGGGSVKIPEGDYGLEIAKVIMKDGKDSGKPNLKISLKVTSGNKKGIGKVLLHNCSLQKQALFNLRNLLEACGKNPPAKPVDLNLDKMVGWKCAGTVQDDTFEGKVKSVVTVFFPVADLGKAKDDDSELDSDDSEEEGTEDTDDSEELFG